jgi:hypothetical protein
LVPANFSSTSSEPISFSSGANSSLALSSPAIMSNTTFSTVVVTPILSSASPTPCSSGQLATPNTCLIELPPACLAFENPTLLGAVLSQADVLACKSSLGVLATGNAAECFPTSLENTLTGYKVLNCLQTNVLCTSCITTVPNACSSFFSYASIINTTILDACQSALGSFGLGQAALCFEPGVGTSSLTGVNVGACLNANLSLCPSTGCIAVTPTPTPTPIPTPTPTPASCIALPAYCVVSDGSLSLPVLFTVDIVACQLALNALLPTNPAATCFSAIHSGTTGQDFQQCLAINLPLCP